MSLLGLTWWHIISDPAKYVLMHCFTSVSISHYVGHLVWLEPWLTVFSLISDFMSYFQTHCTTPSWTDANDYKVGLEKNINYLPYLLISQLFFFISGKEKQNILTTEKLQLKIFGCYADKINQLLKYLAIVFLMTDLWVNRQIISALLQNLVNSLGLQLSAKLTKARPICQQYATDHVNWLQ